MSRRRVMTVLAGALLVAVLPIAIIQAVRLVGGKGNGEIYVVLKTTGPHMEFWQVVRAGIQAAATELGVEPKIVGPEWEWEIDEQIEIFADVIARSPDAVLLAASDYHLLVPLAEEAARKGITIVTLDSALNSEVPVSFVATDNVAAGMAAGREIDRLVEPGRPIALISHIRGVATAIDREHGTRRALEHRGVDSLLGPLYSQNELDLAYEIVVQLAERHPDLGGIVAMNENSTVGAARALHDLGLYERVHLVGFDNSREEIEFLELGVIKALVVQRPFNMGYLGIRTLVQAVRGGKVDPVIYTDAVLVRKDDIFTEEIQRLLFPIVRER